MKKIVAVFVDFNGGQDILDSVTAILKDPATYKVIVVDNASTDGSFQLLSKKTSRKLIFLKNIKNFGFAHGANQGIRKALNIGADYVGIFNSDLVFKNNFISKLAANGADMVQFMLKYKSDGKWVYDFGGKINWPLGKIYHLESNKDVSPNPNFQPDYVSGGASIIKREVFEKIGLFDERFFMYFEDADLSLRAKRAGFTIAIEPSVIIEHKLEIVKKTKNWRKIKNNTIANFHFITKCVPWYFKPIAYGYLFLVFLKIIFNLTIGKIGL